jgi:hypothetical protein
LKGKVVLIAYNRPETTKKVIKSIENSDHSKILDLIVIVQGNNKEVLDILNSIDFIQKNILYVNRDDALSPAQAINMNVHLGILEAFKDSTIDYVVILEDDIVISSDYFNFLNQILIENMENKYFRAFNGFSAIPRNITKNNQYGRYRYGVGWGWAITRSTWEKLQMFWNGTENEHWDGIVEPFFKKGYVISPGMSRILNVGFGIGATHTLGIGDPNIFRIEKALQESFVDNNLGGSVEIRDRNLNWRLDCVIYMDPSTARGRVQQWIYSFNFLLSRINTHKLLGEEIKIKLQSIILKLALKLS